MYGLYTGTDPTDTEFLLWYRLYLCTDCTQVETLQTHSPYFDTDFTYVQTEHIINHLHIRKSRYTPPLYRPERHTLIIVQESWEGPGPVWTSTEHWYQSERVWNIGIGLDGYGTLGPKVLKHETSTS